MQCKDWCRLYKAMVQCSVEIGAHYAMRCARQRRVTKVGITLRDARRDPHHHQGLHRTKNVPNQCQNVPWDRLTKFLGLYQQYSVSQALPGGNIEQPTRRPTQGSAPYQNSTNNVSTCTILRKCTFACSTVA